MPGSYGNDNIYTPFASAYIDYAGTSEAVTLPVGTVAVSLYASTRCWVKIGQAGETATAAAPSGEKVWIQWGFPLEIDGRLDVPVDVNTDGKLVQLAVIQDSAAGMLSIIAMKE
jgi:hypothetical protein